MNYINHIPRTQIQPPTYSHHLLHRERLVKRVSRVLQNYKLTIIAAPAGFGKTTLAVETVTLLPETPVAWVRLSEDENEVAAFFTVLVAAWKKVFPEHFDSTLNSLKNFSGNEADMRALLGIFINEIIATQADHLVLVLDDYQLIHNQKIHKMVENLITLAPENFRLLILTRVMPSLPLARLRLQFQLAEFNAQDLHFTKDEIQKYFGNVWNISVSENEVETIYQLTGGWVASLQLLALAIQRQERSITPWDVVQTLMGSKQFIYQLLAEEVLERQPEDIQKFLLETSILSELTPELCRQVTGNDRSPRLLEEIYHRNLFLQAESGGESYRYHDLFKEFLQLRLAKKHPGQMRRLHFRAGKVHPEIEEKIRHFLAGRYWKEAIVVLEREGQRLLSQGRILLLQSWICSLPEENLQKKFTLQFLLGTCALQQGHLSNAKYYLQHALEGFRSQKNETAEGQVLLMLANHGSALHNHEQTLFYLKQALSKPLEPHQRVQAHITSAWMHVYSRSFRKEGHTDLMEAIRITKLASDLNAYTILGHQLRAPLIFNKLGSAPLEQYCQEVLERFGETDNPATLGAMCLWNAILLLKGNLEEARQLRQKAHEMNRRLGHLVYISIGLDVSEGLDAFFRNDFQHLDQYWKQQLPYYEQKDGQHQWLVSYLSIKGLQLYLKNQTDEFLQILEKMQQHLLPEDLPENQVAMDTMIGLKHFNLHQWEKCEKIWGRAIARVEKSSHALLFANPYTWLAHLYLLRGWRKQAEEVLMDMFEQFRMKEIGAILLREGEIVGPLLGTVSHIPEARRILKMWQKFHRPRAVPIPETMESLTPREMEVLRLLAQGESNQEIANNLCITVRTVKAHVSQILAKMHVQSRTQAIARAQEWNIL